MIQHNIPVHYKIIISCMAIFWFISILSAPVNESEILIVQVPQNLNNHPNVWEHVEKEENWVNTFSLTSYG